MVSEIVNIQILYETSLFFPVSVYHVQNYKCGDNPSYIWQLRVFKILHNDYLFVNY
jgi:hypothetical protein